MPIGPITPGSPVTVTPDVSPAAYTSIQAPTATMGLSAAHIQALTLALLNVQEFVRGETADNYLNKVAGGTISGPIVVSGTADFQGAGANRPTFLGLVINSGELTIGAAASFSMSGTTVFASGSDTSVDGTGVFHTSNGGKFRWDTRNKSSSSGYTADGTNGYEDILPDPAADRVITLANTGAAIGQRKRFNAQNVTSHQWQIQYGLRTWNLKNASTFTVKIEYVFDGSNWVVDDWEEGGNVIRNG